jgi:hypothetical protein
MGISCRGERHAAYAQISKLSSPGVALIAPMGIQAGNSFQDDRCQDARERNERNQRRYYDRDHRDYHQWDDREDGRYRHWGEERHEAYRPFYKLRRATREHTGSIATNIRIVTTAAS